MLLAADSWPIVYGPWSIVGSQRSLHLNAREFTIALAQQAGELLLDYRRRGLTEDSIRTKTGHFDIVTEADVASERLILKSLREVYPDHGIHAEESANSRLPDEPCIGSSTHWMAPPILRTGCRSSGLIWPWSARDSQCWL